MNDLAEFLVARIVEEECAAHEYDEKRNVHDIDVSGWFDPDRVLAECQAKRDIIDVYEFVDMTVQTAKSDVATPALLIGLHAVLQLHAAVYADHPDYRPEWRPQSGLPRAGAPLSRSSSP